MLGYGCCETLATKEGDLNRLRRNERAMVRWMCAVTMQDRAKIEELIMRFDIEKVAESSKVDCYMVWSCETGCLGVRL